MTTDDRLTSENYVMQDDLLRYCKDAIRQEIWRIRNEYNEAIDPIANADCYCNIDTFRWGTASDAIYLV